MKEDRNFIIEKAIPLANGKEIAKGTLITRTHGMYYMEGGLLPSDMQEDFDRLIANEAMNGWNYIVPVKKKTAFGNDGTRLY